MGVLSVREPAIRQPRGGDSAWEDGGSAVRQVGGAVCRPPRGLWSRRP
jgi:hypothetical protein